MKDISKIIIIFIAMSFSSFAMASDSLESGSDKKQDKCFMIHEFKLVLLNKEIKEGLKKVSFANSLLKHYQNTCISIAQIESLIQKLDDKASKKGFITTYFGLLPQDIKTGILKIGVEVGVIANITYNNDAHMLSFSKDFSIKQGEVLDMREIESGLSNLKRLNYLSPDVLLLPTGKNNESQVVINTHRKSLPLFIQASFDNGGNIGDNYETSLSINWENPLHLSDSLQFYILASMPLSKKNHSYYGSFSYSIPVRKFLFQLDTSYSHSTQEIPFAFITPVYSGENINTNIKGSYFVYTDDKNQVLLGLGGAIRFMDSYLDDIKLDIQTRKLSEISGFISYKRKISQFDFNITLSLLQGLPLFKNNSRFQTTYAYTIPSINMYLYAPFSLFNQLFIYNSSISTQISQDQLYASEKMTIGSRYTVRGFNHFNLSGQMGILYKNDLMMYLPSFWGIRLAPNIGVDFGYVRNLGSESFEGEISGGGIGISMFSKYLIAQISANMPLYNPYKASVENLFFSVGLNW